MELREKIVEIVAVAVMEGDEDYWADRACHEKIADRILAIPEIAEGERYKAIAALLAEEKLDAASHTVILREDGGMDIRGIAENVTIEQLIEIARGLPVYAAEAAALGHSIKVR